jgi:hypothetical protein
MSRPKLLQHMGMACPTAPERIWLQVDPEPEEDGQPEWPSHPYVRDDVTWCADKINNTDTLYIRADKVVELLRARGKSGPDSCEGEGRKGGAPGATDAERAAWLADKIVAQGDYAKEAAEMLRRWPAGVMGTDGGQSNG